MIKPTCFFFIFCCQLYSSYVLAQESATDASSYQEEVRHWHQDRLNRLKSPDGWLSLAGLFWIREGSSTFGSSDENNIIFPKDAPEQIGTFHRRGDSIWMEVQPGIDVHSEGKSITNSSIFSPEQEPLIFEHGDLNWLVMKRSDRFALRLRDRSNPAISELDTIPHYPINPDWRINATFHPADSGFVIFLDDVQGLKREYYPEGSLRFNIQGKHHEMLVLDGGRDQYFLIFGDGTNSVETYGGGRYVYTPRADEHGQTFIDFNKAYNPPCAFTDYATCLLPPVQNKTEILIEAGELSHGDH
ncbi:MAG: DUF1684 domain-containing protein [Saprospiraceae bacterium]|nr:DUF1684 domain-containing protein [Saprospiraceae bacterium]